MQVSKGIAGHHLPVMKSDEWLTPPEILRALGEFDLDPCSPVHRPWPTAMKHYTIEDNGLLLPWEGRVYMNPPYGSAIIRWMKKMAEHDNGIALTFARTDTDFFQMYVFPIAASILFINKRLNFYTVAGTRAKANGGAPSVLIAYGENNVQSLADSGIKGKHVLLNSVPVIVVGISPTWKSVVSISLTRLKGKGSLESIYDLVEQIAPDKVAKNSFYKEKVRQTLQMYFERIGKGIYKEMTVKEEAA